MTLTVLLAVYLIWTSGCCLAWSYALSSLIAISSCLAVLPLLHCQLQVQEVQVLVARCPRTMEKDKIEFTKKLVNSSQGHTSAREIKGDIELDEDPVGKESGQSYGSHRKHKNTRIIRCYEQDRESRRSKASHRVALFA